MIVDGHVGKIFCRTGLPGGVFSCRGTPGKVVKLYTCASTPLDGMI